MLLVAVVPHSRWVAPVLAHVLAGCAHGSAALRCALLAPSLASAERLTGTSDHVRTLVAVYVSGPGALSALPSFRSTLRPVLVIAPLYKSFDASMWELAIRKTAAATSVNLGVAPQTALASTPIGLFGEMLTAANVHVVAGIPPILTPPSAPLVHLDAVAPNSVTVSWSEPAGNVGVASYGLYVNGVLSQPIAISPATAYDLGCGVPYTIGVDAVGFAGNHSPVTSITATPGPCGRSGGGSGSGGGAGSGASGGDNAAPTAPSADTTPPSPPTGLAVASSTQTSLSLIWTASTDNVGVAGYGVYGNGSLVASPSSTAYTLTGLSCGTSYIVAVDAFDTAGNRSGPLAITTSTTACADAQPPTVPVGLAATFLTQSAVTLSWDASSDNVGVVGYDMYLGAMATGTSAQTSYAFARLSCGTSYTVGVDAYDVAGNRSAVSWLIVTTGACADTSPPGAPTNLVESAATASSVSAAWTPSTDNVGVTGYRVFVDGALAGATTMTSYTATGLSCGSSHRVVVDAYDAAGNRSSQTSATMASSACPTASPGDTQPPTAPTGLVVASAGQTMVALTWTASTDNVGVAGYGVYEDGSLVASSSATGYTLMGLTCGTSFTVAVDAYDTTGNRSAETMITTSTAACPDTQPPTAPTNVALATRTATSISISWAVSSDNVGVAGYDLYVGGSPVGTATATAYTFAGLACGTNYTLAVDAYDAAGNVSAQTVTLFATAACPDVAAPSVPSGLSTSGVGQSAVTLSWSASSDNVGVTGYRLFLGGGQVGTSLTTSYVFAGLACGTSYTLAVAALDAAGNASSPASLSVATAACSVGGVGSGSVWVSPAGSDSTCVRGDQSKPCATPGRACVIAQGGDVILVAAGVYSAGFVLTNCNPVSTVTFENAPGTNVFFAGNSSISGSSNIAIQGDRIGHGVGFSLGFTSISSTSNLVWNNVNLYCQNASPWVHLHSNLTNEDACSSALTIGSGTNGFTWNGGDQSDFASCLTSCTHTGSQGNPNDDAITGTATNILIEHVKFYNYFSLDNNGSAGDHSELFVITGGTHVEFLDNSMTDCGPPASTGYAVNNSCNTSFLFFGGSGSANTSNYYTFIQNMIAPGHGQAAVAWDYNVPAGNETTETWKYNSIDGALFLCGRTSAGPCGPGSGSTMTGANMLFVGNIAQLPSYGGCYSAGTYSHNIWYTNPVSQPSTSAAKCSASDIAASDIAGTVFWSNPNIPNFNYTTPPNSPLRNAGENANCPTTDINGTVRPTTTPCEVGAIEG